jgi:transposase-like protein
MAKKGKRTYTLEFKRQAANLAIRNGVQKAADQLGVNVANIQRWKSEVEKETQSQQKTRKKDIEEENRQLRKENEELKKVNFILKKAAAVFSQDQLK